MPWTLFLFSNIYQGTLSSKSLSSLGLRMEFALWGDQESGPVCSPEIQGCNPAFCLVPSSQDPEHHHLMVSAPKACTFFFESVRYSGESSLVGSSITCVRKLSSMHPRSRLYCFGVFPPSFP